MEDSEFVPGNQPDRCPDRMEELTRLEALDVNSASVQALFRDLIRHRVAVTSTLPIFEAEDGIGYDSAKLVDSVRGLVGVQ